MRGCQVWAVVLSFGAALAAASEPAADAQRIARWIEALGSERFAEREEATRALEAIGRPAHTALQKAADHSDLEVQRRARAILARLNKLLEAETILQPTRVRLACKNQPLADAVKELTRASGYTIELQSKQPERLVSFDTGESTFWQAFDMLCQKAGLVEALPENNPRQMQPSPAIPNGRVMSTNISRKSSPLGPIVLMDGSPNLSPTYYAGAVRIRVQVVPGAARDKTAGILLEMRSEPKLPWRYEEQVRIDKAVDNAERTLKQELAEVEPANPFKHLNNMRQPPVNRRSVAVRFHPDGKPSKSLRELSGTITLLARTGPHPFITVDNVLKRVGQTVKGATSGAITVHEAKRLENGQYSLKIQLDRQRDNVSNPANYNFFRLEDDKGEKLEMKAADVLANNNGVFHTVTFQAPKNGGEPARLVYTGYRHVHVDVPFRFKDVPLH